MYQRTPFLGTPFVVAAALVACVGVAFSQNVSPTVHRMTVLIDDTGERGTGVIVGDTDDSIFVVTAEHVLNPLPRLPTVKGRQVRVQLHPTIGEPQAHSVECQVVASAMSQARVGMDVALLSCTKTPGVRFRFSYDFVGDVAELLPSASLMMIGNLEPPEKCRVRPSQNCWVVPSGYFLFDRVFGEKGPTTIDFFNLRRHDLQGASGGPLLTDRSEFLGMVFEESSSNVVVKALTWRAIRQWLAPLEKSAGFKVKLRRQARSAAPLRRNNVEFSVGATSFYMPNFGWLSASPHLRISRTFPSAPSLVAVFDYSYARRTRDDARSETVSLTVPAVGLQWQIGAQVGWLRRTQLLGGTYVGGGIAPATIERTLLGGVGRLNVRAWTYLADAGWRYRLPGKSWGIAASYRYGVLVDDAVRQLYPRFHAFSAGVFLTVR